MKLNVVALTLLCCGVVSCTTKSPNVAPSSADHACVLARDIQSWQVLDKRQVIIWAPTKQDSYLLTVFSPLSSMDVNSNLAFIDSDGDGKICGYGGDKVVVPEAYASAFPATISSLRHIDYSEVSKLVAQYHVPFKPNSKQVNKAVPVTNATKK